MNSALNLSLDFRIPSEYIGDEQQRLRAYKKIADAKNVEEAERVQAELADRYGPVPLAVNTLVRFALLKVESQKLGIEAVDRWGTAISIKFHPGSRIDPQKLMALLSSQSTAKFTPAGVLQLQLPGPADQPAAVLDFLKSSLHQLE